MSVRTEPDAGHLVAFGTAGWQVWREAILRTAGFPAAGLDDLAAPAAAAAADALLAGDGDRPGFDAAFDAALRAGGRRLAAVAADPRFVEAVTWQNPGVLVALDGLVRDGGTGARNQKLWTREEVVSRYWQRYCGKNETIGFFGPIRWTALRDDGPAVTARPGRGLVSHRVVFLEYWALTRLAATLAADPAIAAHLPVRRAPHLALDGTTVHGAGATELTLSAGDAAVLGACDGRRSALDLARHLVAAGVGPRHVEDAFAQFTRLVERGLASWDADLPMDLTAEAVLAARLAAVPDDAARTRAQAALAELRAARDGVAASAGDPAALRPALTALDATFARLTGGETHRRDGQVYAGRTLCHEETVRDLAVDFGPQVLDSIAAPLEILLGAARWLTVRLAEAYGAALREIHDDLAADRPEGAVPLSELWYLANGLLFGAGERPVDAVADEFTRRAGTLFGLDAATLAAHRVQVRTADLAARAAELFAADRPGWRQGRVHSPDLQICAPSVEAINAGDFVVVLGELHAAWPTFDCSVFLPGHDDPERLRAALADDLGGPGRMGLLYPTDWPRHTGRTSHCLAHADDWQLAFAAAPGAAPRRSLAAASVTVRVVDDELVATEPGGTTWPLVELFGPLLSIFAADGFKLLSSAEHTPRITLDRLVVARETWRSTVGELELTDTRRGAERYLAGRRMVARLGLPDRVFVKLASETKPVFVDLTSPVYVSSLATMLRAARQRAGDAVGVTFSELLPGPEDAWVPDADGNRYHSELRLQITDPAPAEGQA